MLYTFKSELLLWTRIWSELSIDIFSLQNFNSSIDFEHNSLTECQLNLDKISWYKPLVWTLTAWSTAASIDISWPAMLAMTLTWILFCPDLTYFKTSSIILVALSIRSLVTFICIPFKPLPNYCLLWIPFTLWFFNHKTQF